MRYFSRLAPRKNIINKEIEDLNNYCSLIIIFKDNFIFKLLQRNIILMAEALKNIVLKRISDVDLEAFVEYYAGAVVEYARGGLELEEFDRQVWNDVAGHFNVSVEDVKYIHHPFHWACFCDDKKRKFESPMQLVNGTYLDRGERVTKSFVKLKITNCVKGIQNLPDYVLREYGDFLRTKQRMLCQ